MMCKWGKIVLKKNYMISITSNAQNFLAIP